MQAGRQVLWEALMQRRRHRAAADARAPALVAIMRARRGAQFPYMGGQRAGRWRGKGRSAQR